MQNKRVVDKYAALALAGAGITALALLLRALGVSSPEGLALTVGAAPNFGLVLLVAGGVALLWPRVFKRAFSPGDMWAVLLGVLVLAVGIEVLLDYLYIKPLDFLSLAASAIAAFVVNFVNGLRFGRR